MLGEHRLVRDYIPAPLPVFVPAPDSLLLILPILDDGSDNPARTRRDAITRRAPFLTLKK